MTTPTHGPSEHPTRRTTDFPDSAPAPWWRGPLIALLAYTAAYLGTRLTWPLLEPTIFMLFFGAVGVTAYFGGLRPALAVIALTAITVWWAFYPPYDRPSIPDWPAAIRLAGFVAVATLITALSTRLRDGQARLHEAMQHLDGINMQLRERIEVTQTQAALLEDQAAEMEEQASELEEQVEHTQLLNTHLEEATEKEREAREIAEAASRAKSEFLTVMSHELRTPLNAIIGYGDLLSTGVPGPLTDRQQEYVAHTNRAAFHLLELIEQILSLSRIEAGQEVVHDDAVELDAIVREGVELMRPLAERKNLRCELTLPDHPVRVQTDAGKVRQVMLNLMGNAAKFTEQGAIRVSLETVDGVARVRVADTGIGIPASELERIFEPFVQVSGGSTTRLRGGTGLGLPVSRRLAHLLGGELTVESREGAGSAFTLTLPLARG